MAEKETTENASYSEKVTEKGANSFFGFCQFLKILQNFVEHSEYCRLFSKICNILWIWKALGKCYIGCPQIAYFMIFAKI